MLKSVSQVNVTPPSGEPLWRFRQRIPGVHAEVSSLVKVPREKAYSAYTDFEAMPKWSRQGREVKAVRREGDVVFLEMGEKRKVVREMRLFPPDRVESEGETRFKQIKTTVVFEEVPGGTRVTASLDVQVKGRWAWVLKSRGRAEVGSSAMEELPFFAKYVESLE